MADPRAGDATSAGDVQAGTRLLLASFVGLTLLAVLALLVFSDRTDEDFAWSIRVGITAAFLGAAFAAGCLLSLLSLRRNRWVLIRVPVGRVGVFTAMAGTTTIVHDHRLHLFHGILLSRSAAWV